MLLVDSLCLFEFPVFCNEFGLLNILLGVVVGTSCLLASPDHLWLYYGHIRCHIRKTRRKNKVHFNIKKKVTQLAGQEKLQSNSKIIIKTQNESCQLYPSRQRTTCHRCLVSKSYLSLVINWTFLSALIFCIFLAALALSVQLGSLQSDPQVHNNRTRNRNPSWRHRLSDNIFQFPFSTSHEIREENFYYLWHLS